MQVLWVDPVEMAVLEVPAIMHGARGTWAGCRVTEMRQWVANRVMPQVLTKRDGQAYR
jgi:hypothetical protein